MRPATSRTTWIIVCIMLLMLVAEGRVYLNIWLLQYVNQTLNHIRGYRGSVESISIDLYRGAYRINKLKVDKTNAHIPTPFISIKQTDLSLHWSALIHGRIVSSIELTQPVINFAVNKKESQTGAQVDWTQPIKKLMPIDINIVTFNDGKLTYQDFSSNPKVDIYINNMQGDIRNLRNVTEKSKPLPSTVFIQGDSIGKGKLSIQGRMNILKQIPDMDLQTQLENVYLPALNNYSNAYGNFNFRDGQFSLYSEFIVKDKQVSGYIKPIARHVAIEGIKEESNPFKVAWEGIVSGVVTLFSNHAHDQFATKIPLSGNLDNIQTSTWSTIGGIFHNAFVAAFQKGLDASGESNLLKKSQ